MLNGKFRGEDIGSGTHVWKFEAEVAAGRMSEGDCFFAESCMSRSNGHCMTMGTASTMACMAESLGMQMPNAATWPAVDARRFAQAQEAGRRIVDMVETDLTPAKIMTRDAFENAIRTNAAIGGSTNALIHLTAIARRLGVPLELDDFDTLARPVPTLVNLMPSGKYLMEDFCYAGGLPVVHKQLADHGHLHTDAMTVTGRPIGENVADAECWNAEVITTYEEPFQAAGTGTAILHGNLAPGGAVIKQSAATERLLQHRGRALVYDTIEEYNLAAKDPDLDVTADDILVIRGAGPRGYPGMPEVSNAVLPTKLLEAGVEDMVRICDGRMSGTGYGTVVLHVTPESALGGPFALVRTGDEITLDVPNRSLRLEVDDAELERRRQEWKAPEPEYTSGYAWLYVNHVLGADDGADLDFLQGRRGHAIPRDSH